MKECLLLLKIFRNYFSIRIDQMVLGVMIFIQQKTTNQDENNQRFKS